MKTVSAHPDDYIASLPEDRKEAVTKLRALFLEHLPSGFTEEINYGMIGYVIPHSLYPSGYHCDPKLPLPFINLASQKNFVAIYHMGLYADPALLDWFVSEYPKHSKVKLDIGKSCIRLKKMDQIPYLLLSELATKMSPDDWINLYEKSIKKGA